MNSLVHGTGTVLTERICQQFKLCSSRTPVAMKARRSFRFTLDLSQHPLGAMAESCRGGKEWKRGSSKRLRGEGIGNSTLICSAEFYCKEKDGITKVPGRASNRCTMWKRAKEFDVYCATSVKTSNPLARRVHVEARTSSTWLFRREATPRVVLLGRLANRGSR
jgi:hypothetical protein